MSRIAVIGGGFVGLSMAMMLARQGHEVTVLERDGGGVPGSPDEAWQAWNRHGVAQFRQRQPRATRLPPRPAPPAVTS